MSSKMYEQMKREYLSEASRTNKNTPLLLIIGIILIFVGIYFYNNNEDYIKNAKATTGIVYYERDSIRSSREKDYYDVYVKYNVNGKEYYERLKGQEISRDTITIGNENGKEITIYYNPDNPAEIKDKSASKGGIIVIIIGVLMVVAVIGDFIYRRTKKIDMDDSTPNYTAAEKVVNFFDNVESKTGIFEKTETVGTVIAKVGKIAVSIFCLLIIGFGILCVVTDNSFSSNSKEVVATVSKITNTEKRDSDNKRYIATDVYVKYEVNGIQYEEQIDMSSKDLKQGSKIKIFYNTKNPSEIKTTNKMQFTGFIIILVGFVFFISSIFLPTKIQYRRN